MSLVILCYVYTSFYIHVPRWYVPTYLDLYCKSANRLVDPDMRGIPEGKKTPAFHLPLAPRLTSFSKNRN